MASKRELGWQAFQQGDVSGAITLLETACRENPGDYEAHLFLGAAYGKAGRSSEAVSSITTAVQLQPSNPQARYNLGVALENAGFIPEAIEAFQQAVALDPNYVKASDALRRLQRKEQRGFHSNAPPTDELAELPAPYAGSIASPPGPTMYSTPSSQPTIEMPTAYSANIAPTQSFLTSEDVPSREASAATTQGFAAPVADIPGFVSSGPSQKTTALPSYGLLSNYSPSPNSPGGPTAMPEVYPSVLPPPNYHDELDFVQALKDFWQIIVSPLRFFSSQAGRIGFMSPICMLGIYLLISMVVSVLSSGLQGVVGLVGALIVLPFNLVVILCGMMISYLLLALFVHFLGMMFGNRTDYSVSFRAVVYADAPRILIGVMVSLWMTVFLVPSLRNDSSTVQDLQRILNTGTTRNAPMNGGASGPASPFTARRSSGMGPASQQFPNQPPTGDQIVKIITLALTRIGAIVIPAMALGLVGWMWSTVLLIVAIHKMQNLSPLAACGVWIVMFLLGVAFAALIIFACFSLFAFLISQVLHHAGAPGGISGH